MTRKSFTLISLVLLLVSLTSCITSTKAKFITNVEGATVYLDGENIGTTPFTKKLSNGVWEDANVFIHKDGYEDLNTKLKKEAKIVNCIFGLTIWVPSALWCYGPKDRQFFVLTPVKQAEPNESN